MAVVMLMPEDNEEDWMKYASAGFGQTDYSLWDEDAEEVEVEEEQDEASNSYKYILRVQA